VEFIESLSVSFRTLLVFLHTFQFFDIHPRTGTCLPEAEKMTYSSFIMFGFGIGELLLILIIVLIVFGAGKLPEIGEGLGKGIKNFRKAVKTPDEIDVTPESNSSETSEKKS